MRENIGSDMSDEKSIWSNEITPSAPITEREMRESLADEKKACDARLDLDPVSELRDRIGWVLAKWNSR